MTDGTGYFQALAELFTRVEVTTAGRSPLQFGEGLARAVEIIRGGTRFGRKVIFVGNGGAAATASHQAVDYWKNGGMRAIAFNDSSLLTCIGNDFGYEQVFEKPIQMFADAGDMLVAMSSSGRSPNILRGVAAAEKMGCRVITMSGFAPDNPLRVTGELNFYVPSPSHGHVEITHLAICHAIVDTIVEASGPAHP